VVRFTLAAQPPPPEILASTIGDQTCLSFTSAPGTVYELERAEMLIPDVPVGSPNAGNGWDTTSAVTIDHHSGQPGGTDREVLNAFNGDGVSGDGNTHGSAEVSDWMWLARGNPDVSGIGTDGSGDHQYRRGHRGKP
jgi:hypothetical protein